MILKPLGQTEILVSPIALGTVKLGRNQGVKYPQSFDIPSDEEVKALFSLCQSLNINFIDTAPAYGLSESRIGELLPGPRHDWVIATKAGEFFENGQSHYDFSKSSILKSVHDSLRKLKTDYLDLVLIHSDGADEKIITDSDAFEALYQLKQAGHIRALGMSTKTAAGGLAALPLCDVLMMTYNPLYTDELPVLQEAQHQNKGILIKKGLMSGHLNQLNTSHPLKFTLDFIFAQPAVTSLVVGTINLDHLREIESLT